MIGLAMALREFTDCDGRQWKAWDMTREELHPATRAEPYLHDFVEGWLVFEAVDGREKRRLRPIPRDWIEASDAELEQLLETADPVRAGTRAQKGAPATPRRTDQTALPEPLTAPTGARSATIRWFRYPGGRFWSVHEQRVELRGQSGEAAEDRMALRFASGARVLDLASWPREWAGYTDEQLADLLFRGFPRDPDTPNPTSYRRRRDDRKNPGRPPFPQRP